MMKAGSYEGGAMPFYFRSFVSLKSPCPDAS